MLKNLTTSQIEDIHDILDDMKNLPHRQFKKNHYGMIKIIDKARLDLKCSNGLGTHSHDDLIDTFNMNFVVIPKILRRVSTPAYTKDIKFVELVAHYNQNDVMTYNLWKLTSFAFFYWNDKYI